MDKYFSRLNFPGYLVSFRIAAKGVMLERSISLYREKCGEGNLRSHTKSEINNCSLSQRSERYM